MVSEKTKRIVYDRDDGMCQGCGSQSNLESVPHHCNFRSQYFGVDRDQPWNLVMICRDCHDLIHFSGTEEGTILKRKFIDLANERKRELERAAERSS